MADTIKTSIGERWRGVTAMLLLLLVAALFSSLGQWQLQRGREQRMFEAEVSVSSQLPELTLGALSAHPQDAYRNAVAEGIFDSSQQYYIEGRRHEGRIGYHVVTPLRINGTRRYVLVNRGWIPERAITAEVPPGRVQVSGTLVPAQTPALRLGEPVGTTRPYFDPEDYRRETGRQVEPLILAAESTLPGLVPVTVDRVSKRGMHEGYAVQWFAFSGIAFLFAAGILLKRFRHES